MNANDVFRLDGKLAVITGASRGIGAAIAKTLAEAGAHTVLASRKLEGLREVERDIAAKGGKATSLACHTGYLDELEGLFREVEQQFGKLDILVNNAATNPHFGDVLSVDARAWDKTMDVNLKGVFFGCQLGAKLMLKTGGGAIVNVASVNGVRPARFQSVYSITKAGVISLTQAFAKELAGSGIRVNALLPGLTDTHLASALVKSPEALAQVLPSIPLNRVAQPEEMAGIVLYLVSPASSYATGGCFVVDGGMLA